MPTTRTLLIFPRVHMMPRVHIHHNHPPNPCTQIFMQFVEIKKPYSIPSLSYYDQYHHDVSTSSRKMRSGEAYSKHSYRRRSDEESGEGSVENGGEARSRPLSSSSCASKSPVTQLEAAQSATAPHARWVPDPVDALRWI